MSDARAKLVGWPVGERARPLGVRKGPDGYCFQNALSLVMRHEGWKYCEGIAVSAEGLPCHHAWCIDERGLVVESTWPALGREYRGKAYPTKAVVVRQFSAPLPRHITPSMLTESDAWALRALLSKKGVK